ncbi:hypothetical protein BMR1_03g03995 [Babesia microti strain RI]|uniref:Uncharacterized protein n=1 Tax=Babesia microti (strain RI) TaxID=1133968 RepID=A0A0K3ANW5_BABMR|nr:hypothetical protein BMR1_03g03995 [Babesia microti strain RI]CTQ41399.1 hypothetical protein BMR1_03g03995 [Babesia microti strain RI]|eukprot:XP_012649410.1 hypothetical protein BMR1_03g03995 [Babesia microti strain RI]
MIEANEDQSNSILETNCIASNFADKYGRCRQSCMQRHLHSFLTGKRLEGILKSTESAPAGDNIVDVVLATLTGQKLHNKSSAKLYPEDKVISQLGRENYAEFKTQMIRCEYNCAETYLNLFE